MRDSGVQLSERVMSKKRLAASIPSLHVYNCLLKNDITVGRLNIKALDDSLPPDSVKETIFGTVLEHFKFINECVLLNNDGAPRHRRVHSI